MSAESALDLGREALLEGLWVIGPILLVGLAIAVVLGIVQSIFQWHDAAITTIPRLVLMVLVLVASLPWITSRLGDMGRRLWSEPVLMHSGGDELPSRSVPGP
jgi:flagellar biosynthetic protein FliQ